MSMTDPIADMLTRIRNAQKARLEEVAMPVSRMKADIARVMKEFGYISGFDVDEANRTMTLTLRYTAAGEPVIRGLRRESSPGLRRFCGWKDVPRVLGGLGTAVISTSSGVMSGIEARRRKLGGEIICTVW